MGQHAVEHPLDQDAAEYAQETDQQQGPSQGAGEQVAKGGAGLDVASDKQGIVARQAVTVQPGQALSAAPFYRYFIDWTCFGHFGRPRGKIANDAVSLAIRHQIDRVVIHIARQPLLDCREQSLGAAVLPSLGEPECVRLDGNVDLTVQQAKCRGPQHQHENEGAYAK